MNLSCCGSAWQPRQNKYDDEETEYWVDVRTSGNRGTDERTGKYQVDRSDAPAPSGDLGRLDASEPMSLEERRKHLPAGVQLEMGNKVGP